MQLREKHVVVIGTKRSGLAAIELLQKQGAHVRAMDANTLTPEEQARFAALGVPVVPQEPEYLTGDLIVLSPAVPYDLPMLVSARERGIPVIGEVELSSYFLQGPVIGITGSNGKTTTTALTGHLLKECDIACQVGGNIGTAVASLVDSSTSSQWNVLELSSFQLESISRFEAKIAVCLNVTPDHLDRHGTFKNYANAKARLFETQDASDYAVLNLEDQVCRSFAARTKAEVCWFSTSQPLPRGVWMRNDQIFWNKQLLLHRNNIKLRGLHNVENAMAAAFIALLAGAQIEQIGSAIASFPGVEHRIEFVRHLEGVNYFNDSKATNVDASLKAIDAFDNGLWIILGGKDKGSDYTPLREPLERRAKAALLIGAEPPYPYAAAPLIKEALANTIPVIDCGTLDSAVRYARVHAQPGDTVLLAPACASFDQFQNFEERGKAFKQVVTELS
ncbi:MAG: UDP-N-acetylmuramoyl-L-alanine--D-glutamate ligase [Bryobacteraceae bacterium]